MSAVTSIPEIVPTTAVVDCGTHKLASEAEPLTAVTATARDRAARMVIVFVDERPEQKNNQFGPLALTARRSEFAWRRLSTDSAGYRLTDARS
jgi:hypothetical protein